MKTAQEIRELNPNIKAWFISMEDRLESAAEEASRYHKRSAVVEYSGAEITDLQALQDNLSNLGFGSSFTTEGPSGNYHGKFIIKW